MTDKEKREYTHALKLMEEDPDILLFDSVVETACPEGCVVEPDGECPHGYRSPLLVLGVI